MKNNEGINLKKDKNDKFNLKKCKVYIIGGICFIIGFMIAPNGVSEEEYLAKTNKEYIIAQTHKNININIDRLNTSENIKNNSRFNIFPL